MMPRATCPARRQLEKVTMSPLDPAVIVLAGIALSAAFVNGALGYGFSSLTVPVALVFYANRVLNPAVVVVEVFINLYVLVINLDGVRAVWKRVVPILIGLLPGIAAGSYLLAAIQPSWIKFGTYGGILPLPGSRLAETGPVDMARRSPFPIGAGHRVLGDDHFW